MRQGETRLLPAGLLGDSIGHRWAYESWPRFGVRAYLGPGCRSATYDRDGNGVIQYG
jgi:hypothetical protein